MGTMMTDRNDVMSAHSLELLLEAAHRADQGTGYVVAMDRAKAIAEEATRALLHLEATEQRPAA